MTRELPSGWESVRLGDICRVEYGKGLSKKQRVEAGSVYVYGSAGRVGRHDCALVEEPVIIVGRKGNAGSVWLSDGPSWPIDTTFFLRPPDGLSHRFLALQLGSRDLVQKDSSTTIPSLRRPDLEETRIDIAPVREQERIVEAIEEHFSRLDAANRSLLAAEGKLRALPSILANAATRGWASEELGRVAEVFVGSTPSRSRSELWKGPVPWVSSGEVQFCRIRETRESISVGAVKADRIHPPGTVLLGMIGEGRTRGQAAILDIAAAHNQNSAAIRVDRSKLIPEWLFHVFRAQYDANRSVGSGNNQLALNKARVQELAIPLPPLKEQTRLVRELGRAGGAVDHARAEVQRAQERCVALRKAVLAEAFSGRLVPQDIESEPALALLERISSP
ncbi:restriction endonuclease subunit S [Candidatus Poriferisocius sp.]|uniref:restriction endonuclease subunit S n=1 Tax=Candidatus Poriferisocius sp. TaxID=3101276 RepID=UPI003B02C523